MDIRSSVESAPAHGSRRPAAGVPRIERSRLVPVRPNHRIVVTPDELAVLVGIGGGASLVDVAERTGLHDTTLLPVLVGLLDRDLVRSELMSAHTWQPPPAVPRRP